jgi:hypothetical protein
MKSIRILYFVTILNSVLLAGMALYLSRFKQEFAAERDRVEAERCRTIVEKMNRNRQLMDIEPVSPEPTNYAGVLEEILQTSEAFMKKSMLE